MLAVIRPRVFAVAAIIFAAAAAGPAAARKRMHGPRDWEWCTEKAIDALDPSLPAAVLATGDMKDVRAAHARLYSITEMPADTSQKPARATVGWAMVRCIILKDGLPDADPGTQRFKVFSGWLGMPRTRAGVSESAK